MPDTRGVFSLVAGRVSANHMGQVPRYSVLVGHVCCRIAHPVTCHREIGKPAMVTILMYNWSRAIVSKFGSSPSTQWWSGRVLLPTECVRVGRSRLMVILLVSQQLPLTGQLSLSCHLSIVNIVGRQTSQLVLSFCYQTFVHASSFLVNTELISYFTLLQYFTTNCSF